MTESDTREVRYLLGDGLGSIRHAVDEAGTVVAYQEYSPYGEPIRPFADSPYSFTGEWWESEVGLLNLRARWYSPEMGTFLSRDAVESEPPYQYVGGNVVNRTDPSGLTPPFPPLPIPDGFELDDLDAFGSAWDSINWEGIEHNLEWIKLSLLKSNIIKTASRLNNPQWTNMTNNAFAAMLGAKVVMEDSYWLAISEGRSGGGLFSWGVSSLPTSMINQLKEYRNGHEMSWGVMNNPTDLGNNTVDWWVDGGYSKVGKNKSDFRAFISYQNKLVWPKHFQTNWLISELETSRGAVEHMGAAMMFSAYQATQLNPGQQEIVLQDSTEWMCYVIYPRPQDEISAHIIASGVINHGHAGSSSTYGLVYDFNLSANRTLGSSDNWVNAIPYAAEVLGLSVGDNDYLDYTPYEKRGLGIE